MRALPVAMMAMLTLGVSQASWACAPRLPPAVRAAVAGWTMSCQPRAGANAPCGFERAADATRIGVEVISAATDAMLLSVLAPVTRMTVRTTPEAEPIVLTCVTSHAMCEPELISRCQVPLARTAELTEALTAERDVAVVLEGAIGPPRVLDAKGFGAAWARYGAMLREQRGRAVRWFAVPQPTPVRRTTDRR